MMMPLAMGSEAVAWVIVLVSVELAMRMVLRPSMPASCDPLAVPTILSASTAPVEYKIGEPDPAVVMVELVTDTYPPPRSVAAPAL